MKRRILSRRRRHDEPLPTRQRRRHRRRKMHFIGTSLSIISLQRSAPTIIQLKNFILGDSLSTREALLNCNGDRPFSLPDAP